MKSSAADDDHQGRVGQEHPQHLGINCEQHLITISWISWLSLFGFLFLPLETQSTALPPFCFSHLAMPLLLHCTGDDASESTEEALQGIFCKFAKNSGCEFTFRVGYLYFTRSTNTRRTQHSTQLVRCAVPFRVRPPALGISRGSTLSGSGPIDSRESVWLIRYVEEGGWLTGTAAGEMEGEMTLCSHTFDLTAIGQ